MSEKPILFSGPMVRAILKDHDPKTNTRRVMKPQPVYKENSAILGTFGTFTKSGWNLDHPAFQAKNIANECPYGKAGDTLWVRETFYIDLMPYDRGRLPKDSPAPVGDRDIDTWEHNIYYRADGECCEQIPECACVELGPTPWRPSIHMPRWASRITLKITNVRVERLQDISPEDVKSEGVDWPPGMDFKELWDSINAKKHPWESNPWVWVVSFKTTD